MEPLVVSVMAAAGIVCTAAGGVIGALISARTSNRKVNIEESTAIRTELRTDLVALRSEIKESLKRNFDCEKREIETAKLISRLEMRVERLEEMVIENRHRLLVVAKSNPLAAEIIADMDAVMSAKVRVDPPIGFTEPMPPSRPPPPCAAS